MSEGYSNLMPSLCCKYILRVLFNLCLTNCWEVREIMSCCMNDAYSCFRYDIVQKGKFLLVSMGRWGHILTALYSPKG